MTEITAKNAQAGVWYLTEKWGRVLCCGTTGGDWITSFAVRLSNGRTVMKYFGEIPLRRCEVQNWNNFVGIETEAAPVSRPPVTERVLDTKR